jgi:SP family myo-inositol transporter-like MFS transporter 13
MKQSIANKSILRSLTQSVAGEAEREASTKTLRLIIGLGSIGGFLFGYDTGVISGALVLLAQDFSLSAVQQELVVGVCVGGAFLASSVSGYFADRYGRRTVVLASSLFFIAGSVLLCLATTTWFLYAGRIVVGLGVGSASMIVPVLLSECSPAASRGAVVTCVNVAITFGQLAACLTAALLAPYKGSWRIMLGLAAFPAVLQLVGFYCYIPESPRWLCQSGQVDKGTLALRQLRDAYDVREELSDILDSIQVERDEAEAEFGPSSFFPSPSPSLSAASPLYQREPSSPTSAANKQPLGPLQGSTYFSPPSSSSPSSSSTGALAPPPRPTLSALLSKPRLRRPLLLGVLLQVAQQLAGVNTVMYYSSTLFTSTGAVSTTGAVWLSLGTAACNFVGSIAGHRWTDKVGRRRLLLGSTVAVIASLLAIAAAFKYNDLVLDVGTETASSSSSSSSSRRLQDVLRTDSATFQVWACFAAMCLYLLVFAPGLGSVPWTVCSEIFPTSCRGAAASVTTSANWAANFAVSASFLSIVGALGTPGTFVLSAGATAVLGLWLYLYLPETQGLPLEDVKGLFSDAAWGHVTPWPSRVRQCCCDPPAPSPSSSSAAGGAAGAGGAGNHSRGLSDYLYSSLRFTVEEQDEEARSSNSSLPAGGGVSLDVGSGQGRGRRVSVKL